MPSPKSAVTHVTMMVCLVVAMLTMSHVEASDTWAPTGSMSTTRAGHTATLLPDGRVLVTGGFNGNYVSSAELYDPRLGTWSPTAAMSTARSGHTATLLTDGRVLVRGGSPDGSNILASAEIYDPARGTWSPTGSMRASRNGNTTTLLLDGRVLVTGGVSGGFSDDWSVLGSAEIYDPALGTWSPTSSMGMTRFDHKATLLQDGRVLVSGGHVRRALLSGEGMGSNTSASAEIYDPALGTWSQTGSMTADRELHTATLLLDGRVLVSGGGAASTGYDAGADIYYEDGTIWVSAEIYDPVSGTWWETGSMRAGTFSQNISTLLSDGRVLVFGVYTHSYPSGPYVASSEIYDPSLGIWSPTAGMSTRRLGYTATLLPDGQVLVSGGSSANTANTILASAEIYSPGPPLPEDATPPQVSCAAADGAWHNTDVTIACTASDLGSGLANAADASFHLTTNVPAGTETANAVTNSRQVCDVAGNCSTAAPITGNKVDKKAPTITIASPAAGATYGLNAKVGASYACSDGGAGMTSCAGTVANGSLINTSPMGTRTFAVTATDAVGNSSTRSVTYTVSSRKK